MTARIDLIDDTTLAVCFPYHAGRVAAIKTLARRRWNATHKRWEVHVGHLREVVGLLGLSPENLTAELLNHFQAEQAPVTLKVELGSLEGRLCGPGIPVQLLEPATSYLVPGHEFSPLYKKKKWDGRRRLLNARTGIFPAGLWPAIREALESGKIPFSVEYAETTRSTARLGAGAPRTELRPYQRKALTQALAAERGIIQIATGGGKTLLAAHLIQSLDRPTIFFVHTLDLLYQAAEVFRRELGLEVGLLGDGQATLRPLTVATIQTAARAFEGTRKGQRTKKSGNDEDETGGRERELVLDDATREQIQAWIEAAEVVVFDECHHVPADTFYKIAMRTPRAGARFGLSATPWREDENDMLLEAALGRKICAVTCSALIDGGYLVPPRIEFICIPTPRGLPRRPAWQDCYRLAIEENQQRNRLIAARARELAGENRSVLVLVATVAHGRNLENLLPEARFAYGALDSSVRSEFLSQLERKLHPILIATTLADEGLDLPSLNAVILAGGGKSQTRAYQRIGRALRTAPGKTEAVIVDFMDEAPYLRRHSEARMQLYRQEPRFEVTIRNGATGDR